MNDKRIDNLVNGYIPTGRGMLNDQGKNGRTNTHKGTASLDGSYPMADDDDDDDDDQFFIDSFKFYSYVS